VDRTGLTKTLGSKRKMKLLFNTKLSLHQAAQSGNIEAVRHMCSISGGVNEYDTQHETTPLILACQEGHLDIVRYLVEQAKADINATSRNGRYSYHIRKLQFHHYLLKSIGLVLYWLPLPAIVLR